MTPSLPAGSESSPHFPLRAVVRALEEAGLLTAVEGTLPDEATGISDDSRAVGPGMLFVALRGSDADGHTFLAEAAARGASVALIETPGTTTLPALLVREGRRAAGIAAAVAYGEPATRLSLTGVTGTNGKTTTVAMLRHLLDESDDGRRSASIGTLGVLLGSAGDVLPGGGGLTTPGPVELQRVLRMLVDHGVRHVAMEVSSHSLDQRRVAGLLFDAAVFTNLTRDHLDYHETMEAYYAAKARLVDHLAPGAAVVLNADDPAWSHLSRGPRTVTFSTEGADADVQMRDLRFDATGTAGTIVIDDATAPVRLSLLGDFNVSNAAAAAAAAHALGVSIDRIAEGIGTIPQVPGRLEIVHERPTVLRDYSHTPDSLARALAAMRPFARGRLIVVFGAGGDRDPGKRAAMGRAAQQGADVVIVTSDNPRTEDPERILDAIESGMSKGRHERIEDRRAAIARALEIAHDDDVVLLAGKGHETYQIRGTTKHPFDERAIVAELAAMRASTDDVGDAARALDAAAAPS